MKKLRIGLDIDGVMYCWDRTARYMLREILPNSPYTRGALGGNEDGESTYWYEIRDKVSREHWDWLWTEGVRLGLFRYGHIYPGTVKAVRELATLGDIIIITHRPKQAVEDTLAWLSYLKLPIAGVHLLTSQEPKSSVHPFCHAYLDDKPENCVDFWYNTTASVVGLMDRPWNQDHPANYERVRGWDDFIKRVRAL